MADAGGVAAGTVAAVAAVSTASPTGGHGLLFRCGLALVFTLLGLAVLISQRRRLPSIVAIRSRRIFVEVVLLCAFELTVGVLASAADLRAAFAGRIAPSDNAVLWALPFVAAFVVLLQGFAFLRSDTAETKFEDLSRRYEALDTQLKDARSHRNFLSIVMRAFLNVVSFKRARLKAAKTHEEGMKAFQPTKQGMALTVACWEVFDKMINPEVEPRHRVRVAYFRVIGNGLVPVYCWNGNSDTCVSLVGRSPIVTQSFTFDAVRGCVARSVANSGETRWIPSAEAADKDPSDPFFFFDQSEHQTLRSMVVVPIRLEGDPPPYDVLSVDTGREGYFNAADRSDQVRHVVENMAHRLLLEKEMERLSGGEGDA